MIKIVHYSPETEEQHKEFALKYWNKRKRTTPEYIYWKFRGKNGQRLESFILAVEENKVIGQLGLIPCSIMVEGEKVGAQWACDLMVDTDYRGRGIAKLLYEYAYTLKPLTLGSDPSPAASISMKRAGFVSLNGPYKFFFPVCLGEITRLKGFDLKILDRIPNPFLIIFSFGKLLAGSNKFSFMNLKEFQNNPFDFYGSNQKMLQVHHDQDFMRWRCQSFKDYYRGIDLFLGKGESGFFIYHDQETCLITDYSSKGIFTLFCILTQIIDEANQKNMRRVKLMVNNRLEFFVLMLLGFLPFRTRTEIIFYCSDKELKRKMRDKYFRYTFMDSDENI